MKSLINPIKLTRVGILNQRQTKITLKKKDSRIVHIYKRGQEKSDMYLGEDGGGS